MTLFTAKYNFPTDRKEQAQQRRVYFKANPSHELVETNKLNYIIETKPVIIPKEKLNAGQIKKRIDAKLKEDFIRENNIEEI